MLIVLPPNGIGLLAFLWLLTLENMLDHLALYEARAGGADVNSFIGQQSSNSSMRHRTAISATSRLGASNSLMRQSTADRMLEFCN